jgi:hypothetical protein
VGGEQIGNVGGALELEVEGMLSKRTGRSVSTELGDNRGKRSRANGKTLDLSPGDGGGVESNRSPLKIHM